jgi:hypothetical protein
MKREVVQDFLNLPGIEGVALMDGRSRPYFFGLDQTLNFQQRQVLAQGIQQVVETTPTKFESFEFQFTGHHIYIYRLDEGTILLVLTNEKLMIADYLEAIQQLKTALQTDTTKAVAIFRLLAGSMSLTGQNYWKATPTDTLNTAALHRETSTPTPTPTAAPSSPPPTAAPSSPPPTPAPPLNHRTAAPPSPQPTAQSGPPLSEVLTALNSLSQFAAQYLGKAVVTNYWKSSRPDADWLNQFQIERTGTLSLATAIALSPQQEITPQQQAWIQQWVSAFIDRCTKVIRDFPALVAQKALDEHQHSILLSDSDFSSPESP